MFTKEDKKNTSRVFFGIVLYTAILQAVVMAIMVGSEHIDNIPSWLKTGESIDDGAMMLCAVFTGCLVLWIYFSVMQKKHGLFNLRSFIHCTAGEEEKTPEAECRVQCFDSLGGSVFRKGMRITVRILFIGLCYAICCQIISRVTGAVIEHVFNGFGFSTAMDEESFDVTVSIPMALYIAFLGPFAEELVYRGFLMNGLKPYGKIFAIIVSSVFFSLMHGNLEQIPFAFLCGIFLGYVASEYSVIASTLVHIINNGGLSFGMLALQKAMSEMWQGIILLFFLLVSVIVMTALIIVHKADIKSFIRENTGKPGTEKCLINIWVFIFFIMEAAETALSLTPLN